MQKVAGMCLTSRSFVGALDELLARKLANRFQHPEARVAANRLLVEQAFAQQALDPVDQIEAVQSLLAHGRRGGVEREAIGEHSQTSEEDLFRGREQIVAPGDRRAQGSL